MSTKVVASAMPVSLGARGPLYLWDLVAGSSPLDAARALAPLFLGLGLLILPRLRMLTRLGLALGALGLFASTLALYARSRLVWVELYADELAYVGRQPVVVLLGLGLVATGASLRPIRGLLPWARALLALGALLLALLYVLPQRGRPFLLEIADRIAAVLQTHDPKRLLGYGVYWLFDLFPLVIGLSALLALRRRAHVELLGSLARYGLAGLAALMCYRYVVAGFGAPGVLVKLRAALLLAVGLGAVSYALEAIFLHLLDDPLPPPGERSDLARDRRLRALLRTQIEAPAPSLLHNPKAPRSHPFLEALMARRLEELREELCQNDEMPPPDFSDPAEAARALHRLEGCPEPGEAAAARDRQGALLWLLTGRSRLYGLLVLLAVGISAAVALRHRLRAPDLSWSLRRASKAERAVFAKQIPDFIVAVARKHARLQRGSASAQAAAEARALRRTTLDAARAIDLRLGERLEDLATVAEHVDRRGALWVDAIIAVNRAIRAAGLPFVLDPHVLLDGAHDPPSQLFYASVYEVQRLRRFAWAERPWVSLWVRQVDRLGFGGDRLGFVRSDEPFALVLSGNIEGHVAERLQSMARLGRCTFGRLDPSIAAIEERCAQAIHGLLDARGLQGAKALDAVEAAQLKGTERHELQHLIDGDTLAIPAALFDLGAGVSDERLLRAAQEASAYLCELDQDDPLAAAWTLAQLTALIFERSGRTPYRLAAALVLGAGAREPVLDPAHAVALRAPLLHLWRKLAESQAAYGRLRARMRAAHEALFAAPCARPIFRGEARPGAPET